MEHISVGLINALGLVAKKPASMLAFVLASMAVAFIGFLPVLVLNQSWLDPLQTVKVFYSSASVEVAKGTGILSSLNLNNLGPAGLWVFGSLFWKYLVTLPFQIVLFLPLVQGKSLSKAFSGLRKMPGVIIIQLITGLTIIATAVTGILITIAVFAGAAAPFFMIIVLLVVLSLVVVLTLSPFGFVLDGMQLFKSIGFSFSNSLKFGWAIFLTLLITSIIASMVNNWTGNIGPVSDFVALMLFIPQYCILHSVYERMVQDAPKTSPNI